MNDNSKLITAIVIVVILAVLVSWFVSRDRETGGERSTADDETVVTDQNVLESLSAPGGSLISGEEERKMLQSLSN